jgi:hypothetical protein
VSEFALNDPFLILTIDEAKEMVFCISPTHSSMLSLDFVLYEINPFFRFQKKIFPHILTPAFCFNLLLVDFSFIWFKRGAAALPKDGLRFCQKRNAAKHGKMGQRSKNLTQVYLLP